MKNPPPKKVVKQAAKVKTRPQSQSDKAWYWMAPVLIIVTFFTYWPSLQENGFTNKDDNAYVYDQPLVKSISPSNIVTNFKFSSIVAGNYAPVTIISLALDYARAELDPKPYHITNLLFHILNTLLIFIFFSRLTNHRLTGFVTALLFAIHPMHVESVAWISGRKDVLFVFFYVLALLAYLWYSAATGRKNYPLYIAVTVCFILSLLAKGPAVTLPVVLVGIDYYKGNLNRKTFIEKIPFFLIALGFGILTYYAQKKTGAMEDQGLHHHYSVIERLALGCFALGQYLWKFFVPVHQCSDYPYPKTSDAYPYLILIPLIGFLLWKYRKDKDIVFGSLFFIANIVLLLQFIPVGSNIIAERYSYLSYTGLFFIVAALAARLWKQGVFNSKGLIASIVFFAFVIFFCVTASARVAVWRNNETLWNDVKEKYPDTWLAYGQLGGVASDMGHNYAAQGNTTEAHNAYTKAIDFYTQAIDKLKKDDSTGDEEFLATLYVNRAHEYIVNLQNPQPGIDDCNGVIKNHPKVKCMDAALARRGFGYVMQQKFDSARSDFQQFFTFNKNNPSMYINLGNTYALVNEYDTALTLYSKDALAHDSSFVNLNTQAVIGAKGTGTPLRAGQLRWMIPQ